MRGENQLRASTALVLKLVLSPMVETMSRSGLSKSCVLIIVVASVERFTYKGVASNLVTYLTEVVNLSTSSAAKSVNVWCGVTSLLPLVGALLGDSYWDRYSTILASSLLYVVGLLALTSWALLLTWVPLNKTTSLSPLFWSLYLISVGQGGYNPCMQAFGADQLEEGKNNQRGLFFQWWYFGICIGSLLGVTFMPYIQDTIGWGVGFGIPTIAMGLSVLIFSCGSPSYIHKQANLESKRFDNIMEAIRTIARKMANNKISIPPKDDAHAIELGLQDAESQTEFSLLRGSDGKLCTSLVAIGGARVILRLFPMWVSLLMSAVIFQQPPTFFTKQGNTMERTIGKKFEIPPAALQSAIAISIILLMPLYDRLLIPIFKLISGNDKGITVLQRIGIGMFLSIVAMVVAALVETKRLGKGSLVETETSLVPLSIFWLLPQYVLLGIADIFTVVGMQEFFYTQVPSRMRTMGIALNTSVFGVGSFCSALLILVVEFVTNLSGEQHGWFSDNLNKARLDNYYWLLAVLCTLSFTLFVKLTRHYNDREDAFANEDSK